MLLFNYINYMEIISNDTIDTNLPSKSTSLYHGQEAVFDNPLYKRYKRYKKRNLKPLPPIVTSVLASPSITCPKEIYENEIYKQQILYDAYIDKMKLSKSKEESLKYRQMSSIVYQKLNVVTNQYDEYMKRKTF